MRLLLAAFAVVAPLACALQSAQAVQWEHPAGMITGETLKEIKGKIAEHDWAKNAFTAQKRSLDGWVEVSSEALGRVFPKKRGNVYHNFSCPTDRCRLEFDPFDTAAFKCPVCTRTFTPDTNANIYPPGVRYYGTMYDGWACLFYQASATAAVSMGIVGRVENDERYLKRGVEILLLYADTIEKIETKFESDRQMSVLLTYHREGDSTVLQDLACAYELLREYMTAEQRSRYEQVVLQRMLDDIMLDPIYTQNHNNLYQWHRTVLQAACALEREDLIDWSFGYAAASPERQPEHRSIRRLAATHFKPDGAYWEMCSGYHLYPLHAFCELAVLSRNISRMDPGRFAADKYDLTDQGNPAAKVIDAALKWFMSMAMPDRTMPTVGDSMAPRAGMADYYMTAEVGYRFFDLKAVGDYEAFRKGDRGWPALLYGAGQIVQQPTSYTSSCLSSGWVSLRNQWRQNKVWVGLNAFVPGGAHQHADRLGLLLYSHGKLLAMEKATPYNESTTGGLATLSSSHNTVTVDKSSQPQGESLQGDQIPKVSLFFAGPIAQFAELQGDHIYSQAKVYRRSTVLIEDVVVDVFRVVGGTTHDWMLQHAGDAPRFSMTMADGNFDPADWLYHGTDRVRHGTVAGQWDARWTVDDVTSRLTMMGQADTNVYALETYPVDNAVITPESPACQTLCVRRENNDSPFVAVWDAWRDQPNLKSVTQGSTNAALMLKTASNVYYLLFAPGQASFEDGTILTSDAAFSLWRGGNAALLIDGTALEVKTPEGTLRVALDKRATVSAEWGDGVVMLDTAGQIQYDTYNGRDHFRDGPGVEVSIKGDLWQIRETRRRVAGTNDHITVK